MDSRQPASPRITSLAWGSVEVEGSDRTYKDAKLFPGGSREWDWRETGTRHQPGIQPGDVEELLEHGARTVVLSRGVWKRLDIASETMLFLDERGVAYEILQTEQAVERYNELAASEPVGALIHSTC